MNDRDTLRPVLPRLAAALLRHMIPHAERDEVLDDLQTEYVERASASGRLRARAWLWRQVLSSFPALLGLGMRRGWSGFEPRANRARPGGALLQGWAQDTKFAVRRLRTRPSYTVLAVMTLALGVGGTAAAYGIVKRVLLEPLPARAPAEVVTFWAEGSWSKAEFLHLRPLVQGFQELAIFRERDVTMQVPGEPARLVRGAAGSADLLRVIGVTPAVGTGFRVGDDLVGAEPVAVLSDELWRQLGADPAVVGTRLELGGVVRTVVGVMPRGFWFPDPGVRVWLAEPLVEEDRSGNWGVIGRLRAGATPAAMAGELARVMDVMHLEFAYAEGQWDKRVAPHLIPLRERLVGGVRPALLATLAAMALILLIASVNVTALMLGQVDSRGSEMAVRTALGAGRRRLLQQVVVESLVVGVLAGMVGALLASLGFRFLAANLPLGALEESATLDWSVFAAAFVVALIAATLVALLPAISLSGGEIQPRLTRARTGGIGGRGGRLESALVVGQVALILLMAAGAGLLIRSVGNLRAIDSGVQRERVAVIDVLTGMDADAAEISRVVGHLVERLSEVPGVESVGATQRLPLRGSSDNWGMAIEGRSDLTDLNTPFRVVTPGYLEALGVPLLSGRGLSDADRFTDADEGTVVINQELADRWFPGVDPVGQRISFTDRWDRIVGVVGNVDESDLNSNAVPARYMVHEQVPWLLHGQTLVLRVRPGVDPVATLDLARRAIHAAEAEVAIRETTTMQNVYLRAIGPTLQVMSLLSLLGVLSLSLGLVGVYGVVSHFVTRRRRDWAIRIALGMRPARVVREIVGSGGALVAGGIVIGSMAFLLLARSLSGFLYEVGPGDPTALLSAAALLLASGLLAAYLPARRAGRIDPALALREQ